MAADELSTYLGRCTPRLDGGDGLCAQADRFGAAQRLHQSGRGAHPGRPLPGQLVQVDMTVGGGPEHRRMAGERQVLKPPAGRGAHLRRFLGQVELGGAGQDRVKAVEGSWNPRAYRRGQMDMRSWQAPRVPDPTRGSARAPPGGEAPSRAFGDLGPGMRAPCWPCARWSATGGRRRGPRSTES